MCKPPCEKTGVMATNMSSEDIHEPYPKGGYAMSVGLEPFKKNRFEGRVSTVFAGTTTEKSGQYICPPATIEPGSDLAQDEQLAENMMKLTRAVAMEKTSSESVDQGCPMKDY